MNLSHYWLLSKDGQDTVLKATLPPARLQAKPRRICQCRKADSFKCYMDKVRRGIVQVGIRICDCPCSCHSDCGGG